MNAGKYDIVVEQGATWRRTLTWTDAAEQPVDLTGAVARMHVRATVAASTTWVVLTSPSNGIVLGTTNGQISLLMSAAQTAALPAKKGVYDLEIVLSNGDVLRLLEGSFTVRPEITR